MEQNQTSEFRAAFEAGKQQSHVGDVGGVPVYAIANGMKIETLEKLYESQQSQPRHLKQTVELLSIDSFIRYFNRFAGESSTIFANPIEGKFIAILDYHSAPSEPAWGTHKLSYLCPRTVEWSRWIRINNEKMSQEEFALFIEDNSREITDPNGAEMLEIAASLKAKNNVNFRSSVRLDNGQTQFTYEEKIDGQAGITGQLQIPEKIKLVLKPFQGGHPYEAEARFRYRITQQGLVMWYTLIRPHLIQEDAVRDVLQKVREEITTGHVIEAEHN